MLRLIVPVRFSPIGIGHPTEFEPPTGSRNRKTRRLICLFDKIKGWVGGRGGGG